LELGGGCRDRKLVSDAVKLFEELTYEKPTELTYHRNLTKARALLRELSTKASVTTTSTRRAHR
jgi:hypothetical protein